MKRIREPWPEPDNGYDTTGDILVAVSSLVAWTALWFYFESRKVEAEKRRARAEAAAQVPWDELLETSAP